jgi:hypothetical protein
MGGNKKKTINITSKHTNDNRARPVETIIEPILQNDAVELPFVSSLNNNNTDNTEVLNSNTNEIVITENALDIIDKAESFDVENALDIIDKAESLDVENALDIIDKAESFDVENAVDDADKAESFDVENAVDDADKAESFDVENAVDDADTEDSLDDTPNTEVCYEMGKLNELPNNTPALSELDTIMLDEFDTLDTIHTEDEIDNESYEPINNINEYVKYNIPEDNYCELPALVIDYTKSTTAGIRAIVCAGEYIKEYQGVEVFIHNNQTYVRPFSSLSNSPFFGVAQHDANIGEDVAITTSGITKIQVSKTINLPYLIRSGNQCVFAKNQKNGTIATQITSVPININDILVGYGTNNDTLTGPNSIIHSVNKSNNTAGRFTVYKKILINQSQCKFVIDTMDTNNIQIRKGINTHGRTITVLDPMPKSTDLCIVMI